MSMEQFLENLSLETLNELKKSAISFQERGDAQLDGEAEIDKLLMMHMSKHHHEDEVTPAIIGDVSAQSVHSLEMEPPQIKREISKKKRPAKIKVMNLALETMATEKIENNEPTLFSGKIDALNLSKNCSIE